MRVISGKLRGRVIDTPPKFSAHPMGDRVKSALFNILGDIEGLTVLDAFAGSGALGIEAVSRGAKSVVAVEKDSRVFSVMSANVIRLGVGDVIHTTRANVASWSARNVEQKFDIVLCDPPYDDLQEPVLEVLTRHLKSTSIMIISHPAREPAPPISRVILVDEKTYGDAALAFYRRKSSIRRKT